MSERKVYEIARMMSDSKVIEADMQEALNAVTGVFKDKYIKRLNDAFGKCKKNCLENPSKEVKLIQSLKPFMPEEKYESMDNLADMMVLMETFGKIQNEAHIISQSESKMEKIEIASTQKTNVHEERTISAASAAQPVEPVKEVKPNAEIQDQAIHTDGIYETDKNCMMRRNFGMPTQVMSIMLASAMFRQP